MAETTKRWRRIKVTRGVIYFDNKAIETKWVQFTRDWEDGHAKYQKGQRVEMSDKEKLMFYLEGGHVIPCQPEQVTKPKLSGETALYQITDSFATHSASYVEGKRYELPVSVGDKYVSRSLATRIQNLPPAIQRQAEPEEAVNRKRG